MKSDTTEIVMVRMSSSENKVYVIWRSENGQVEYVSDEIPQLAIRRYNNGAIIEAVALRAQQSEWLISAEQLEYFQHLDIFGELIHICNGEKEVTVEDS